MEKSRCALVEGFNEMFRNSQFQLFPFIRYKRFVHIYRIL